MFDFLKEASELFEYTRELRRDFHSHPELGFTEFRTADIVARELKTLGLDTITGVAETGVIALIEGSKPGPVVMLRFDMDALPIFEETKAVYASLNPGVMHACGHDGHTAIGLTIARLLASHRDKISGQVKLIFQPAEEGLGGALRMISEGAIDQPKPDYALSLHLWNSKPVGWIGITPGPVMSASQSFKVRIFGKGGHGANPQQTIDPIMAAAQVINLAQTIVSRNVSPLKSAVISFTSIHGGTASNVIPPEVELQGTIRTFETDVQSLVLERFNDIITKVSEAMGCKAEIDIEAISPAVVNDGDITKQVQKVAASLLPDFRLSTKTQTMGSEDMAFFLDKIPGCYIFIGSANSDKGFDAAHHHPRFDFDEDILPQSVAILVSATFELLNM